MDMPNRSIRYNTVLIGGGIKKEMEVISFFAAAFRRKLIASGLCTSSSSARQMFEMETFDRSCSIDELGYFLSQKGASDRVVESLKDNYVNGSAFVVLTEDDIKQLTPLIGDRALLRSLLKQVQQDLVEQVNP